MRLFLSVLLCVSVHAADVYIRDGGSGAGTSWSDALDDLPATLTRGNTYWVADGTYAAYTFNDAESGTSVITIKKATTSDHGTETGWSSAYGDGEAVFSGSGSIWIFSNGYYTINGQYGTADTAGSYGFRLYSTAARSGSTGLTGWNGTAGVTTITNVAISFVEFDFDNGTGTGSSGVTRMMVSGEIDSRNCSWSDCYFHHSSGFVFYMGQWSGASYRPKTRDITIQRCYFKDNGGGGGVSSHWELFWFTDVEGADVRYNIVENVFGPTDGQTGWWMVGASSDVRYYGNLLFCSSGSCAVGGNGIIATWSNDAYVCTNITIVNNTFVDIAGGFDGKIYFTHNTANDQNVVCQNNLYYNSSWSWTGIDTHSHEAVGGGQSSGGTSAQTGITTSIFQNYAGDDFRLSTATDAGTTLASPYTSDMLGSTRGSDGVFDRGAYEYVSGGGGGSSAGAGKSKPGQGKGRRR